VPWSAAAIRGKQKRTAASALARRHRQLAREALGVTARADLREQAVRLAQLSLALLPLAALSRQLGELNVDQRLVGLGARLARQLQRPCERRLDLRTGGGADGAEQDPRQCQV